MHRASTLLFATSALVLGCRDFDDRDLTDPPDGSQCPAEAPAWCAGACVDPSADALHCGACGVACDIAPHALAALCSAGGCAAGPCQEGFADCDKEVDNGCEVELATSREHCGACDTACATQCRAGACDDPIEVSAGPHYTCAIRASGTLWCWGDNESGNLGAGSALLVPVPQLVPLPGRAVAVTTSKYNGGSHTCALVEDGTVLCWGANTNGQLGTGDLMGSNSPLPVMSLPESQQIAAGGLHTCALSMAHQVRCWGANGSSQLGLGVGIGDQHLPALVLNNVDEVAAGAKHTCARRTNGQTDCWGANEFGQVGIGPAMIAHMPAKLEQLPGAVALQLGFAHSCALLNDATVRCWGYGAQGQLGLGEIKNQLTPQPVDLPPVKLLAAGLASSAAATGASLWGWGENGDAQLGTGTTDPAPAPVQTKIGEVVRIALGSQHACAIRPTGELVCWGNNAAGQLGTGTTTSSAVPVPVTFPEAP